MLWTILSNIELKNDIIYKMTEIMLNSYFLFILHISTSSRRRSVLAVVS